jgi:hypothetical protein
MDEARDIRRRLMGREGDDRRFEKTRKVREEQTRSVREEASEEDRRQWEETRDISKEASEPPEEAHDRPPTENRE